jgi:hypothetical protein
MSSTISIEIDTQTASELRAQAEAHGLSLSAYLQSLAGAANRGINSALSPAEFEQALDELGHEPETLPTLPDCLDRRKIYDEHD